MKSVLLAGSTGYLGQFILSELTKRELRIRALARNVDKLKANNLKNLEIFEGHVTEPDSIQGCCDLIDTVISTIGITRQKDGLSYMDVDFQANLNLLKEAKKGGVRRFIYISVLNGEILKHLSICRAKELFADELSHSGLDYCVIRPNGFFSDIDEFMNMAKRGRIYLFGKGQYRSNPIHGADLAAVCADSILSNDREIKVGGPQTLTQNEIALLAFNTLKTQPKITHIPDWIRKTLLTAVRTFTKPSFYGPLEFFCTVMAMDMIAPEHGNHTLEDHFCSVAIRQNNNQ